MKIVESVADLKAIRQCQGEGVSIGFVPTMGNLHAGHMELIRRSVAENSQTWVTVFVNPTQFNQSEDFAAYPRTLAEDKRCLVDCGVDYLWLPEEKEMYAEPHYTLSEQLVSLVAEGEHRPGHFDGVLTILLKLFSLLRPKRAYFGEKDYQQLLLVQGMVKAFFLDVGIIACPTVRNQQGLALSSRNSRLSSSRQDFASALSRILFSAASPQQARQMLLEKGFEVEYVVEKWGRRLAAVEIDGVRLIDNIKIEEKVHVNL